MSVRASCGCRLGVGTADCRRRNRRIGRSSQRVDEDQPGFRPSRRDRWASDLINRAGPPPILSIKNDSNPLYVAIICSVYEYLHLF